MNHITPYCTFFRIPPLVLLGVLDQKVGERTFQANMERRVALLLGEAMGVARRVKRATIIGNSSVQVLSLYYSRMLSTQYSKCDADVKSFYLFGFLRADLNMFI